jgi:hypothetical protein
MQIIFIISYFYVYNADYYIFHFSQTNEPKGRNMNFLYVYLAVKNCLMCGAGEGSSMRDWLFSFPSYDYFGFFHRLFIRHAVQVFEGFDGYLGGGEH